MLAVLASGCRAPAAEAGGVQSRVQVVPFSTPSPEHQSISTALADSLASALSRLPGVAAEVAEVSAPAYVVRGDYSVRDGRMVIAVRLYAGKETGPVWSSTFWRHAELNSELVNDLAQAVAEAVYAEVARTALTTGRKQ